MLMIPLGYMAKRIVERPDWLDVPSVRDVYAVSDCISPDFTDYITFWAHNGFWFFDKPSRIARLCSQHGIALDDLTFVYYEAHPQQFKTDDHTWHGFGPDSDIKIVRTNLEPKCGAVKPGWHMICTDNFTIRALIGIKNRQSR